MCLAKLKQEIREDSEHMASFKWLWKLIHSLSGYFEGQDKWQRRKHLELLRSNRYRKPVSSNSTGTWILASGTKGRHETMTMRRFFRFGSLQLSFSHVNPFMTVSNPTPTIQPPSSWWLVSGSWVNSLGFCGSTTYTGSLSSYSIVQHDPRTSIRIGLLESSANHVRSWYQMNVVVQHQITTYRLSESAFVEVSPSWIDTTHITLHHRGRHRRPQS